MSNKRLEIIDELDAAVFTGDILFDKEACQLLEDYMVRWTRAIEEHRIFERLETSQEEHNG
jgi:hypothetical protein